MNMRTCDRRGRIGPAPSKEEFCIAHRAQKLAEQYKCPLIRYHEEFMKNNEMDTEGEKVLKRNMEHLGNVGGIGKGSCGNYKNGGMIGIDVPIIWRKHMGNIVKGTFCNLDGEWYWQKVASCGCKNCKIVCTVTVRTLIQQIDPHHHTTSCFVTIDITVFHIIISPWEWHVRLIKI